MPDDKDTSTDRPKEPADTESSERPPEKSYGEKMQELLRKQQQLQQQRDQQQQ